RFRQAVVFLGWLCAFFCSEESEEPLLPELEKKFCRASLIPVEPEPTPKMTKPTPKASARKTNIHFACARRRLKKSCSSQLACLTFDRFGCGAGCATEPACGRGRRLRCCVPRAMTLLAGSGSCRRRSSPESLPVSRR